MLRQAKIEPTYLVEEKKEIVFSYEGLAGLICSCVKGGTSFRFKVKGFSMTPFIKDDDIVTISPLLSSVVRIGALVAFIHPSSKKLIIHRVIKRAEKDYLLKGDNLPKADGWISREGLLGMVTRIERKGKLASFGLGPERTIIAFLSRIGLLFLILQGLRAIKNILAYCLSRMQDIALYRRLARALSKEIEIKEANEEELRKLERWLDLKLKITPLPSLRITDFVAKKGERIMGFVCLVRYPEGSLYTGYWLFGLKVRLPNRGMGIGEGLTKNVISKAKEENAQNLSLLVYEDNHSAISLYRKLGFKMQVIPGLEEELEKEKSKQGRRRVVMVKTLSY